MKTSTYDTEKRYGLLVLAQSVVGTGKSAQKISAAIQQEAKKAIECYFESVSCPSGSLKLAKPLKNGTILRQPQNRTTEDEETT